MPLCSTQIKHAYKMDGIACVIGLNCILYTLCIRLFTTWHKDAGDDDEEGKAEEGSEGSSKKKKPWGDSSFYCPVSLKEQGVLWPGSEQYALR